MTNDSGLPKAIKTNNNLDLFKVSKQSYKKQPLV